MPATVQEYVAAATEKGAADLVTAFGRLPEDKRHHRPSDTSRSAMDQVAECAVLNGYTVDLLRTRKWPIDGYEPFARDKAEAAALEGPALQARLAENTKRVAAAIRALPDDALPVEVEMPWGPKPLSEIIGFPLWNMTYHEGQINYIASLLGG